MARESGPFSFQDLSIAREHRPLLDHPLSRIMTLSDLLTSSRSALNAIIAIRYVFELSLAN